MLLELQKPTIYLLLHIFQNQIYHLFNISYYKINVYDLLLNSYPCHNPILEVKKLILTFYTLVRKKIIIFL